MNNLNGEQLITNYIENYSESQYDEILSENDNFDVFYHLSEGRKGILNWYDFDEDASVLEVGGGYGALSSLFCEKCREVIVTEKNELRAELIRKRLRDYRNVFVLAGDFQSNEIQSRIAEKKFNYIVLMGLLELQQEPVAYLLKLKNFLTPNGKVLLAVDNPYGAHFLAGGTHPIGRANPFETVNGWGRRHFTRQQLLEVIGKAGFSSWKIFYPMPDYHFTQVVYSDEYLPQTKLSERIQTYYRDNSTLVANEKKILDDAVANDSFEFVANSFLVECSMTENVSKVNYAAITLERNKEQSCITKIYNDKSVSKEAVHEEGIANIKRIADHVRDLCRHGLIVVPCEYTNGIIKMPYCDAPLLSAILDNFIMQGKDAVVELFDQLYKNTLQSSDEVEPEANSLLTQDNQNWDWGPILRKCYFEMIPMNCFYNYGEFIYFDQEFVRDNFPAKYTLYRALRNTYSFNSNIAKCVTLGEMKRHYSMEQIWDVFEKEDNAFLSEIRKKNHPIERWARIDYSNLINNQKLLGKNKEE